MLYIIGTGALARNIADTVKALRKKFSFVTNVEEELNQNIYMGVSAIAENSIPHGSSFILGMGNPILRRKVAAQFPLLNPITIIHPSVLLMGEEIEIGEGTFLAANSVLTNRVSIGKHCIVNLASTIEHNSEIGDFCEISPGCHLNGYTKFHHGVSCGSGVITIPHAEVGSWSILGAGAVVKGKIPESSVAVGVPAKVIKAISLED